DELELPFLTEKLEKASGVGGDETDKTYRTHVIHQLCARRTEALAPAHLPQPYVRHNRQDPVSRQNPSLPQEPQSCVPKEVAIVRVKTEVRYDTATGLGVGCRSGPPSLLEPHHEAGHTFLGVCGKCPQHHGE